MPGETVPDGAGTANGERRAETFRSPIASLIWWVWLAFAVANLIDLAVQGSGRSSAVAAAVLILATGIVYVAALRPRVIADDEGIVVRNPLRDHRVPWPAVSGVDIADLLRVHCSWQDTQAAQVPAGQPGGGTRRTIISAWAIQSSRRSRAVADMRANRPGGWWAGISARSGLQGRNAPEPVGAVHRKETERIARTLAERAREEHARQGAGTAASGPAGPVATWYWPSAAALVIPVLLLIATILA